MLPPQIFKYTNKVWCLFYPNSNFLSSNHLFIHEIQRIKVGWSLVVKPVVRWLFSPSTFNSSIIFLLGVQIVYSPPIFYSSTSSTGSPDHYTLRMERATFCQAPLRGAAWKFPWAFEDIHIPVLFRHYMDFSILKR